MENLSEKKKRGRPVKYSRRELARTEYQHEGIWTCQRSLINYTLMIEAFRVLWEDVPQEEHKKIWDIWYRRKTVMAALGRLALEPGCDWIVKTLAGRILEEKLTCAEAVEVIRVVHGCCKRKDCEALSRILKTEVIWEKDP